MNQPENKTPDSSELADLKRQCSDLTRQVVTLLVALFLVSGTLTVYIGVQSRRLGNDLKVLRPQGAQIREAAAKEQPVINKFMAQLVDYGRTHADFAPIVAKYRLTNAVPASASSNAAAPVAPVPKK